MKASSNNFFTELTKIYHTRFAEEVKETPVVEMEERNSKMISAADVWNIQRNKRARVQRRYSF